MGYAEANMSIFLGPDLKNVRKLAGFLIEYSSKYEDKDKEKSDMQVDVTNALAYRLQQEMQRWKTEPWLLPEFVQRNRDLFLTVTSLRHSRLHIPQLIERSGAGPNGLLANSLESVRAAKESELAEARMRMKMQEENVEQKARLVKMRRNFAEAFGAQGELAARDKPLSIWEKKRLAKERWDRRSAEEESGFLQQVLLARRKRHKEKKKDPVKDSSAAAPGQEGGTSGTGTEAGEQKQEAAPERQETPQEAFQRKLDALKLVGNIYLRSVGKREGDHRVAR
jgi:hypothetical protein